MVAFHGHLFEVLVPGLARIEAKFLVRFAEQSIPGALYVVGGKGLAVVPFDAVMEAEAQRSWTNPTTARSQDPARSRRSSLVLRADRI